MSFNNTVLLDRSMFNQTLVNHINYRLLVILTFYFASFGEVLYLSLSLLF